MAPLSNPKTQSSYSIEQAQMVSCRLVGLKNCFLIAKLKDFEELGSELIIKKYSLSGEDGCKGELTRFIVPLEYSIIRTILP